MGRERREIETGGGRYVIAKQACLERWASSQTKILKIMRRKIKSIGYIHDLLHFDCGYTDDEIDEIVGSSPGIFNCTNSEIMEIASNVVKI